MDTAKDQPPINELANKLLHCLETGDVETAKRMLREILQTELGSGIFAYKDFDSSFMVAARKHGVGNGAYILFHQQPRAENMRIVSGGHQRAQLIVDRLVRDGMLYQGLTAGQRKAMAASPGSAANPSVVQQGGHA